MTIIEILQRPAAAISALVLRQKNKLFTVIGMEKFKSPLVISVAVALVTLYIYVQNFVILGF